MRNITLSLALLFFGIMSIDAQNMRLNGYAHYTFDDSFDNYYSANSYLTGRMEGGLQWGFGFEYLPSDVYGIEFLYLRQDTDAPVNYWQQGDRNRVIDLGINYIMMGFSRLAPTAGPVEGYGSILAGAVIFSNKDPHVGEPGSITKFALGARLGANFWFTERVGIKTQLQFISAIQAFGGSFYFGTGGGGAGVSTYSTINQFSLGGGLVFNLTR